MGCPVPARRWCCQPARGERVEMAGLRRAFGTLLSRTSRRTHRHWTARAGQARPFLRAYFDSGFLFKLYWQEANTPAAQAIVQRYAPPIVLSRFNEVEMLHVARRKTWLRGFWLPAPLLKLDIATCTT